MCRSDVEDVAAPALTALLLDIAAALADECGSDPALVKVGPVDFGAPAEEATDHA